MPAGYLLLEDGTRFDGELCAAPGLATGEVVFNTAMSGYQESVTDPSYRGQIIVFTYPLIGNYGVSARAMESDQVHARAVIMREGVDREDAPGAEGGWLTWLRDCGIPALTGVDTRAVVRHIRDKGAMRGGVFGADVPVYAPKGHFGNTGAAAGLLELAASVLALTHGELPGTPNHTTPDPGCPVRVHTGAPLPVAKPYAVKVSYTDAGQCAAAVVRKWDG